MRICVTTLCVLASLASIGLADDVSIGKLTYAGVTIVDVKEGMVIFKIPGGRTQSRAFSDITSMSITGLDTFNHAEKLMSETTGDSEAKKLRKEIEVKKEEIGKIKAQVGDVPKTIARFKDDAKRARMQVDAYGKSIGQLTRQLAEHKKGDEDANAKAVKLTQEAGKLATQANAIRKAKRKDWKNQADQRMNQANALLKQAADLDATKLRYQANQKRAEAKKLQLEASRIERARKKDWKKNANNKKNQAKKLDKEAGDLDKKGKHIADADNARRTQITRLSAEIGNLKRLKQGASRKAVSLDNQAKAFPEVAKGLKDKVVLLGVELDELDKKLRNLANEPGIKPEQIIAAIRAYEAAGGLKVTTQVKTIIDFRHLNALNRVGWIDDAATKWLRLADREKAASVVVACCPNTLADKGDSRNAKAIIILKSRLRGMKDEKYHAALLELLVRLLRHEGRGEEVLAVLDTDAVKTSNGGGARLKMLKGIALLDKKEYAQAAMAVTGVLRELDGDSLPEALAVRAKAFLGQADSATDKKKKQELMQKAGLDLMRVVTFFRGSPQAGESLYLAGKIMADLPERPNTAAAARAYEIVARDYAGTAIGQKASIALKTLKIRQ